MAHLVENLCYNYDPDTKQDSGIKYDRQKENVIFFFISKLYFKVTNYAPNCLLDEDFMRFNAFHYLI